MKKLVCQGERVATAPEVLSRKICGREAPLTVLKSPIPRSLEPSALTSILDTLTISVGSVGCRVPASAKLTKEVSAPVVGLSDASWLRLLKPTCLKLPATTTCPCTRRMSLITPSGRGKLNPEVREPSARLSLVRLLDATPLTVVKSPPTKSEVPSPLGSSVSTSPSSCGTKVVLMIPVVASNARMWLRVSTGMPTPRSAAWVKVPPRMIVLPICAIASTSPSRTLGVKSAGSAETMSLCAVCRASAAGPVASDSTMAPTTEAARAAPRRPRTRPSKIFTAHENIRHGHSA